MVGRAPWWSPLVPYITISVGLLVFHNAWIAAAAHHLGMASVLLLSRTRFTGRFRRCDPWILAISASVGASGGLLLYLLAPVIGVFPDVGRYVRGIDLTAGSWPYFIAYFTLVNAVVEESYWRGMLGSDTRRLTLNDFLFSGYHAVVLAGRIHPAWIVGVFLVLALTGWFWRQIDRWNGGLAASTVSHVAADVSVMLAIYNITTAAV
jgi:hypothetical protein